MPGTLDRVATCGATQLMQASARTADEVSEPAVIPADSVNSACRRNIRESRGVTWPPVAAATLVSDEADHLCRGAKRSRGEPTLATRAGVVKVIAFDTRVSLRTSMMTETPHKTGPAWAGSSDDVRESVESVCKAAIEAPCRAG